MGVFVFVASAIRAADMLDAAYELQPDDPRLEAVSVSQDRGSLRVELSVKDSLDDVAAAAAAEEAAFRVAQSVSFWSDVPLNQPSLVDPAPTGPQSQEWDVLLATALPDFLREPLRKSPLAQAVDQHRDLPLLAPAYNAVLGVDDPVAQFMLLWSIASLCVQTDAAAPVDDALHGLGVPQDRETPDWRGHSLATEYGEFRSRLAHPRPDDTIVNLRRDATCLIREFRACVKELLLRDQ